MKSLDGKSIIIGMLLTVGIFLVAGAAKQSTEVKDPARRFKMFTNPNHAYVLDTVTGQVWHSDASQRTGTSKSFYSNKISNEKK